MRNEQLGIRWSIIMAAQAFARKLTWLALDRTLDQGVIFIHQFCIA